MKVLFATIVLAFSTTTAFAGGNSANAKAMVSKIQELGGNIAPSVSGKNADKGDSGWGNVGSRATTGTQVSKSGKNK